MGVIAIENMEFYAFHGCFEAEAVVGNRFLVDLWIDIDHRMAAESDNIIDAVNYQQAYLIVKREMAIRSNLLENVCKRIIEGLYDEFYGLKHVKVKVSKMAPPMGGAIERVSLTLEK